MPYKVFFVEDEIITRQGIRDNVDWEANGFEFCGEATDGEMALSLLRAIQPDVLITDIKMPFMDGLQLSKIVRERMPGVKIIILSGHDEFEYAQKAINLGVTDYLLKPVTVQKMQSVLQKLSIQLDREREEQARLVKLQEQVEENRETLCERLLFKLVISAISPTDTIEKGQMLGLDLVARYYLVMILKIDLGDRTEQYDHEEYQHIQLILTGLAKKNPDIFVLKRDWGDLMFIMKGSTSEYLDEERDLLLELDALLIRQSNNFAWATCGADSFINRADSVGVASLLITRTKRFVLTNNIEAPRLLREEELDKKGWEFRISPWHDEKEDVVELTHGMKFGADINHPNAMNISNEIGWLRSQLSYEEGARFKLLAAMCADGMKQASLETRPGMTEYEIAGLLSQAIESRGVQAIVNLIATDERISSVRHPLPTSKKLNQYAMLVVCGRKWGLICSVTRLIHFGSLPSELRNNAESIARIDAEMIAATHPGNTLGDVFHKAQAAYASAGFPDEWQKHHQGGSAGFAPREFTATPRSTQPVLLGQSFAWNPSIIGVKSEDTILVGDNSNEIITEMSGWPTIDIHIGNQVIKRPAILEK